jgi:hypothetical protein
VVVKCRSAAAGHGRQDHDRVVLGHGGIEAVKNPHVFIVEVNVDEAVQLTLFREDLRLRLRVGSDQGFEHGADALALEFNLGLTTGVLTKYWGNSDGMGES